MENTNTIKQKTELDYQIRNHNYRCKNIGFQIGEYVEGEHIFLGEKLDLNNGEYEIYTSTSSTTDIDSIPQQKNVLNSRSEEYPQFTKQHLRGKLSVVDGMIDLEELDNLFPSNWSKFNNHCFLESISIVKDDWNNRKFLTMFLGS
jgi:hypothetical protein